MGSNKKSASNNKGETTKQTEELQLCVWEEERPGSESQVMKQAQSLAHPAAQDRVSAFKLEECMRKGLGTWAHWGS